LKTVIAGGTGFIGQKLTSAFLEEQHRVVILTKRPIGSRTVPHPHLEYAHWDGRTEGKWMEELEEADAVINLSGESIGSRRWSARRKLQLLASRIESTNVLVVAIEKAKARPSVLVNASAVGYYGDVKAGDVTEDQAAGNDFLSHLCVRWEAAAMAATESGVRVVVLRSGIVLDARGGALKRMLLPFRMFVGGPLGSGRQWFPWIHQNDEIRAILFAVERKELSGPLNLAAPEPATMKEFSTALGKALHRPSALAVPSFMMRVILGEMADIVLAGQRVIPKKLTQAGFRFQFPTLEGALADILRKGTR
jgi:uncharacterized protein (TIGR01777 family)